jgi:Lrp/AsnC family transcriptional regulator, leucine-responsive regulatory protein
LHNHLDEIDLKILEMLQLNSRAKRSELADKTGLSIPSVTDRMHKLENNGYIESYQTKLNRKMLGKDITAFIFVVSDSSKNYKDFIAHALQTPEVLECHSITGDGSHILKIQTANTSSLEKLLSKIQSWRGVQSTRTSIVLSSHKESFLVDLKNI